MIPIRLQFSGVRDFKPTRLILGDEIGEHVLITGPNGVGKSTISFCMGAILYSSKIDLEGLRSNNLPYEKKWYANLELTFKNEGPSRIDAPQYISFRLILEQAENRGIIQREYQVWVGDGIDELSKKDIYRSGDSQHQNFTMYKEDLQYKYKIDPDLFYLIWYQQEVNQFAEMAPQERFRRFSEMHKIDEILRSWEAAIDKLKELEVELESAKGTVKQADFLLKIAKQEYDRLKDNQKRLLLFGKRHIIFTLTLIEKYKEKKTQATEVIKGKERAMLDEKTKLATIEQKISENQKVLIQLEQQTNEQNSIQQQTKSKHRTLQIQHINLAEEITKLKEQLAETEQLRNGLRYSEQETKQHELAAQKKLQEIRSKLTKIEKQLTVQNHNKDDVTNELATLQVELAQLNKEEKHAKMLLQQHVSSQQVKEQIETLQTFIRKSYKKQSETEQKLLALRAQLEYLNNNQLLSERQKEGFKAIEARNIEAFALRDLVTLDSTAKLKDENQLNAIKYTIFYNAINFTPVNDLYYVSLPKIVPGRLIVSIPYLKLKIRDGLSERKQNYAVKALWWIEQFLDGDYPIIQQNILVDQQGLRGAQEKETFILNEKAVAEERLLVQTNLQKLEETLTMLKKTFQQAQQEVETLYSVLKDVQAAESKMLEADRKKMKQQYLENLQLQKLQITSEIESLQLSQTKMHQQFSQEDYNLKRLQEELSIYKQLGTVKHLQNSLTTKKQQFSQVRTELNEFELQLVKLQQKMSDLNEKKQKYSHQNLDLKSDQRDTNYEIQGINKIIIKTKEEVETLDASILNQQLTLIELQKIVPDIYKQALQEDLMMNSSITQLINDNSTAKVNFNNARTEEVKPEAEHNYYAVKKDYDEKSEAVSKTEEFLVLHRERTQEMENKLETTINMNVLKINRLFEKYMDEFQFEGKIECERFEDKKGRIIFQLFIKVRKIGHSGKLEDVGTKARRGKLGKGVSGGEESLSSLLFALALLQNLNTSPSFIILDEFDSALDETRKEKVFKLYETELQRKLIILSPKAHEDQYYANFATVIVVEHDSTIPISRTKSIHLKKA
ncbi:AAA family ATPase [Rummeliibacillus pycnus]|uniref:AAA family ATPase n=1 Tax=Rummeliibacillus pycnus TaxID=101070 RepID=UPI0037C99CD5